MKGSASGNCTFLANVAKSVPHSFVQFGRKSTPDREYNYRASNGLVAVHEQQPYRDRKQGRGRSAGGRNQLISAVPDSSW